MPFFVAVFQEVRPDLLDQVLASMRGDFATSHRQHPGRRSSRIFQRLNQPNSLIALAEWDTQADYEGLRRSPRYQALTVNADPPARIEHLTRLRSFARMSTQPSIVGCVLLKARSEHAEALESFMLNEMSRRVEESEGLLGHEIFRMGEAPGRLVVVHGWRSIEHLEQFRMRERLAFGARLEELGTTTERFTGVVTVQFSRQEAPPEATS